MKKVFSLIATAILAVGFTACSQSDVLEDNGLNASATSVDNAVQFGTYVSGVQGTRAGAGGDITAAQVLAQKGGFGVFAYYTGSDDYANTATTGSQLPNFMYNQQVTGTDVATPVWSYTPVKYWPNQYANGNVDNKQGNNEGANATAASNNGKVSFFAYAPYVSADDISSGPGYGITALSANNSTYDPSVTYKLAADGSGEFVDLLWGVKTKTPSVAYNVNLTKPDTDDKVNFLFRHALTKVGGSTGLKIVYDIDDNGEGETGAGSDDANTLVTVSDITIKNAAANIIKTGTFDLATGDWTAVADGTATEGDLINIHFTTLGSDPGETALNSAIAEPTSAPTHSTVWSPVGVTTTAKNVYGADADPFFLIPGDVDQKLNVTITYLVRTFDANLATAASGGEGTWTKVSQTISNVVTLPSSILKPNKKITLVLHLGLTSVKFAAAVDDWDTTGADETREVWLPSNVEE